jgi:putative DNA primase/helicase
MSAAIPTSEGVPATHIYPPERPTLDERERLLEAVDRDMEQAQAERDEQWPVPIPLVESIQSEPYPLDALPVAMREAVQEVQAVAQAPVAMVATSALSALSMSAQGLHDVERAERLSGPMGVFTLAVADSGERKTTCDDFFLPNVRKWQQAQEVAKRPEVEQYEVALDAWSAQREGLLGAIKDADKRGKQSDDQRRKLAEMQAMKPHPPMVPRLIYSDITPEELGYQLAKRYPSAAITASEGGVVLGGHGMSGDMAMRNMARLNDLWSGQEIQSDRRTVESWRTRNARLTLSLQVQESTLRAFFDKTGGLARGTGFLSRFLVAWPQSTQGTRFYKEPPAHWPKLAIYHQRIERILNVPLAIDDEGVLHPSALPLTAEAKAAWVAFHDEVEARLAVGGDYADIRDVASKCADNAARLAALFHVFEHGGGGAVGLDAMEGGCLLAAWHLGEAQRFFGEIALPQEMADAVRVSLWLRQYAQAQRVEEVTTRDLQRKGPIRQKERMKVALDELEAHHHVRVLKDGKRRLVSINPKLLGGTTT